MTWMFDSGVILYGEIRGWSLLGRVGDCNLQCTSIYYPETENFDRNKKNSLWLKVPTFLWLVFLPPDCFIFLIYWFRETDLCLHVKVLISHKNLTLITPESEKNYICAFMTQKSSARGVPIRNLHLRHLLNPWTLLFIFSHINHYYSYLTWRNSFLNLNKRIFDVSGKKFNCNSN